VTVYVDTMTARFGRMIMCHMLADTEAELHAMADRIGVARRWHQGDHYDICLAKKALAIKAGAIEITQREAVMIRRQLRAAKTMRLPLQFAFATGDLDALPDDGRRYWPVKPSA